MLARPLMEQAITFAWLAVSPVERVRLGYEASLLRRLATIEQDQQLSKEEPHASDREVRGALRRLDVDDEDKEGERALLDEARRVRAERKHAGEK